MGRDSKEHTEGTFTKRNTKNYRVVAEHSGNVQHKLSGQRFDFLISEAEFKATNFEVVVWVEEPGYATLRHASAHEGIAVGRVHLEPIHVEKAGLSAPPPNSRPGDEQLICRISLVASVADYMATEMNTNGNSDDVRNMSKYLKMEGSWLTGGYPVAGNAASMIFGCRTHSNEGNWADHFQDLVFCGGREGGQWDHKPILRPVWGAQHRLGNSGYVYYYDVWSNIHYGYIAAKAGFSLNHVLDGAAGAQQLDNKQIENSDDPVDVQSIKEGYALGQKSLPISIADLLAIFSRNPDWDGRI
ncbi:hypothetical protein IP76_18765 [Rhizobium sp. AAP43]|nr:hypothetical protein IP76_18765 [Rhizobium sp. AAP43]